MRAARPELQAPSQRLPHGRFAGLTVGGAQGHEH